MAGWLSSGKEGRVEMQAHTLCLTVNNMDQWMTSRYSLMAQAFMDH